MNKKAQSVLEYFLILMVLAAITVISSRVLMPRVREAAEDFADNRVSRILGTD